MRAHTHVHIADQMFITNPHAHYTNSSRGNKVGLLQQITKNKNSHLQWLWSFLYVHKEWIVIKKKGTVLAIEENWAKPSWSKWECSNVLYHFISYFFYSWWFDFTFWLLKTFQTQVTTSKWTKQPQWKPFSVGRCQKSQNPWPGSELPCANQNSLNVWNKNFKTLFEAP